MNIEISDITLTGIDTIAAFDIVSGDFKFTLDELQNVNIAQSQEKTDITGKQGRKLGSLKKNKAVTITGTNGLVSAGLMELQAGSTFNVGVTSVKWRDSLDVSGNTATTSYVATGTTGNEIGTVYLKNSNGSLGTRLTQGAVAAEGVFAYDPATKVITFADGEIADGKESIYVTYMRDINGSVMENMSDKYSEKCELYIDATGEDPCGNIFYVQFHIFKADFDGNFEMAIGDSQTVHAFEAEALAGSCGTSGSYWTFTIFGADEADAIA